MKNPFNKRIKNLTKVESIENVTIFGYADTKSKERLFKEVFETCKLLAEAGYTIIDGGGPGVMLAATMGAKEGKGKVVGVTLYPKDMPSFEGRDPENLFDKEVRADNYVMRTMELLKAGQIYVVFQGGTGTISEFGMAWGLARLYFGHHKPLLLYGKQWKKIINSFKENMLMRPEEFKVLKIVESPEDVLDAINEFAKEIDRGDHDDHLKASLDGFRL